MMERSSDAPGAFLGHPGVMADLLETRSHISSTIRGGTLKLMVRSIK
jgi:hypothetical protein